MNSAVERVTRRAIGIVMLAGGLFVGGCASSTRQPDQGTAHKPGAAPPIVAPSIADPGFLEQYAATYRFRLGAPTSIKVAPGGESVLFLRGGPRSFVQNLYEFDVRTGKERVLLTAEQVLAGGEEKLTPEELARRERTRTASRGIASYELSKNGERILAPLSGRLFVIERAGGSVRELKSSAGFPIDPRFSPDGRMVSCVREGELYITDVETGIERRITSGAGPTITNGLAEFVAQEEMDRREGYWWSPDSSAIAFEQADTSGMEVFHIADPVNPEKDAQTWPYPRAGKANARVRLGIVSLSAGETPDPRWVEWDRETYPYLCTVKWGEASPLSLVVQNREQTSSLLLIADAITGATRTLLSESDATWVALHQDSPRWLKSGEGFLWVSEAGGEPLLELHGPGGETKRFITPFAFGFTELLGVNENAGVAYIKASTNPTQQHIWSVPLGASTSTPAAPTQLTSGIATYTASFDEKSGVWVEVGSPLDGEPRWTVRRADGSVAGRLTSVTETPSFTPAVELTTIKGAADASCCAADVDPAAAVGAAGAVGDAPQPREYHAAIIRPRNFQSGAQYPVILSVYAGPGHLMVTAARNSYLMNQWLADHGFIVVSIDGRGTPGRGTDWERIIKGNLIDIALGDQVDGLKALGAKYPEMDLSRVGVYGWSFGGYFSAMAAMRRPDVFKAGVAGAPVCDWRDYDTYYTERFMGLPDKNPGGYDKSNVLTYCKDLAVPLLIVHGTSDDNVYFMHSLKMTDALFRAGKHFEFLALPGFTHMVPDPVVTRSLYGRIADFFVKNVAAD